MLVQDIVEGMSVRIRQWGDMAEEFGINSDGSIRTDARFLISMQYLCGKEYVVTGVRELSSGMIRVSLNHNHGGIDGYYISADMLEPAGLKEKITDEELNQILGL